MTMGARLLRLRLLASAAIPPACIVTIGQAGGQIAQVLGRYTATEIRMVPPRFAMTMAVASAFPDWEL